MTESIQFTDFLEKTKPFSRNHQIIFKKGSDSFTKFEGSVFGRFLPFSFSKKIDLAAVENHKLKIDAPKYNNYNKTLNETLKVDLYYKGIHFSEIDIPATYAELV